MPIRSPMPMAINSSWPPIATSSLPAIHKRQPNGQMAITSMAVSAIYKGQSNLIVVTYNKLYLFYIGIDLEPGREGGTWLAIGGGKGVFKVGALLNLTGEPKPRNAVGKHNKHKYSQTHTRTRICTHTHKV